MKTFLVIGGSSGIGKAIVNQLAAQQHQVIATYHTNSQANQELIYYKQFDVLNQDHSNLELPAAVDGLIYCPGSINLKPFKTFSRQDFIDDFNFQVGGAIELIKAIYPNLKKGSYPSILFFSTVAVQKGFPFHAQVAASKGAIEGLTTSLAAEFAPTVRVNAIAPSLTDTPLASTILSTEEKKQANANRHPLKTIGEASDIANMATFLVSEQAKWITGQIFHVDGGMSTL